MEKLMIERSIWIDAPRERVWQAVIDPVQIAAWFAPGIDFLQTDKTISIQLNGEYVAVAEIEVIDPPNQLTTRNLPDRTKTTTYKLVEEGKGTRFTVIESGFENLPAEERQPSFDQDMNGWGLALENLKAYMEGRSLPTPGGF
jgi:uncharacterized protein YndB with AHSA1/START domain